MLTFKDKLISMVQAYGAYLVQNAEQLVGRDDAHINRFGLSFDYDAEISCLPEISMNKEVIPNLIDDILKGGK